MRGQSLYEKYVSPSPAKQPSALGRWECALLAALADDALRLGATATAGFSLPSRCPVLGNAVS